MKKIINGKLYDIETSKLITTFNRKVKTKTLLGVFSFLKDAELRKTKKGNWFELIGADSKKPDIIPMSEDEAKNILKNENPDKFLEMFGQEVEEA